MSDDQTELIDPPQIAVVHSYDERSRTSHFRKGTNIHEINLNPSDPDRYEAYFKRFRDGKFVNEAQPIVSECINWISSLLNGVESEKTRSDFKHSQARHEYKHLEQSETVLRDIEQLNEGGLLRDMEDRARREIKKREIEDEFHLGEEYADQERQDDINQLWAMFMGIVCSEVEATIEESFLETNSGIRPLSLAIASKAGNILSMFEYDDQGKLKIQDDFYRTISSEIPSGRDSVKHMFASIVLFTGDISLLDLKSGQGVRDIETLNKKVLEGIRLAIDDPQKYVERISEPKFTSEIHQIFEGWAHVVSNGSQRQN